jgi:hypothetical protein
MLLKLLKSRKSLLPLYIRLFKRLDPKIVFVVVSYNNEIIIEACKKLKITTVELQHGVITPYHLGYAFPEGKLKESFPDYFFSFGDFWNNSVNFPLPKSQIFSIGYSFLEAEKEKLASVSTPASQPTKKQLLFISQGAIGDKLSKFASDLIEEGIEKFDFELIYKLHPGEYNHWKTSYPWLLEASKSHIKVIDDSSSDLYQLMSSSEIIVGVFSTAIFEGLSFGVKTFVLEASGIEYMETLIQEKAVIKVSSAKDFLSYLSQENYGFDLNQIDQEDFFKSNAVLNATNQIEKLVEMIIDSIMRNAISIIVDKNKQITEMIDKLEKNQ